METDLYRASKNATKEIQEAKRLLEIKRLPKCYVVKSALHDKEFIINILNNTRPDIIVRVNGTWSMGKKHGKWKDLNVLLSVKLRGESPKTKFYRLVAITGGNQSIVSFMKPYAVLMQRKKELEKSNRHTRYVIESMDQAAVVKRAFMSKDNSGSSKSA